MADAGSHKRPAEDDEGGALVEVKKARTDGALVASSKLAGRPEIKQKVGVWRGES